MKPLYSILGAAILLLLFQPTTAQLNLNWEEIGPNNLGNHTRAMKVDGNGTVWAGSVGGGLWKSTNRGLSWENVAGLGDNLAISSIAINGSNMYVGTGELAFYRAEDAFIPLSASWTPSSVFSWQHGFFQYSGMAGQGVFVSNDGGLTWTHSNGTWGANSAIQNNPFASIQSIASSGQRTFIASLEGLYYSNDNDLANVTKATGSPVFESSPIMDVEVAANGTVLAATKDSIYLSTDNGLTFSMAINDRLEPASPLPGNQVGGDRIQMAVAPSNPNYIYVTGALSTNHSSSGVWQSDDNGVTFERIAPIESSSFQPCQGSGQYALSLEVDPNDPTRVLLGSQTLYEYSDGKGWSNTVTHNFVGGVTTNYVAIPILSIGFDPNDSNVFFVGTDKETMASYDGGQTFTFKSKGYNAAHLQAVSVNAFDEVLASDRYQGMLYKETVTTNVFNQEFNVLRATARGGIGRFSFTNPQIVITQHGDGGLRKSTNSGASYDAFYGAPLSPLDSCLGTNNLYIDRATATDSSVGLHDPRVAPVNPWLLDEYIAPSDLNHDSSIAASPAFIYISSGNYLWTVSNPYGQLNSAPNWTRISLDLTEGTSQDFEFFTALAVSGDQDHVLYAGTNFGKLYRINGAHDPLSFSPCNDVIRLDSFSNMPDSWISAIAVDPNDPDNVVVTYGAYAPNPTRVWLSNDGKTGISSFRDVSGNLPAELPVYAAAFSPMPSAQALVLGTEAGIYATSSDYSDPNTVISWAAENTGLGEVAVYDVNFRRYKAIDLGFGNFAYAPDHTLFIGTYGRGAFRSQTLVSTTPSTPNPAGLHLAVAPNPMDQGGRLTLDLEYAGTVEVQVFDLAGNPTGIRSLQKLPSGSHTMELPTEKLAAGMYLLQANVNSAKGSGRQTLRLMVAH